MDRGETITENVLSDFASGPGPYEETTPILKLFNDIVYYSKAPFCIFFLPDSVVFREKTYIQVVKKKSS